MQLIVTIPVGLFIWFVSVAALSGAISIGVLCLCRLVATVRNGKRFLGSVFAAILWGWFAVTVGWGAYSMGSYAMDSMIERLL